MKCVSTDYYCYPSLMTPKLGRKDQLKVRWLLFVLMLILRETFTSVLISVPSWRQKPRDYDLHIKICFSFTLALVLQIRCLKFKQPRTGRAWKALNSKSVYQRPLNSIYRTSKRKTSYKNFEELMTRSDQGAQLV